MNIITNYSQLKLLVELAWYRDAEDVSPDMVIDEWISHLADYSEEQKDEDKTVSLST